MVKSCLDYINIRLDKFCYESYVVKNKLANKFWTGTGIKLESTKTNKVINEKRIISIEKVNAAIQEENWWPILDISGPNEIYETLTGKFDSINDK